MRLASGGFVGEPLAKVVRDARASERVRRGAERSVPGFTPDGRLREALLAVEEVQSLGGGHDGGRAVVQEGHLRERRVEPRRGGAGVASLEDDERGDAAVVAADEAVAAGGPGEGGDGGAAVALGDASLVPARDAACFLLAADAGLAELDNLELAILERDDEAGVLGVEAEGDDGLVRGAARVGLDEETVEETQGGVVGVALGGAVGGGVAKRAGGGATSEDVHAADVRPEQHVLGRGVQAKEAHARARHGAYRVGVDETLGRVEGKGGGRASVAGGG